jgi:putative membrane-bound dehydrogenase-like protein
MQTYGGRGTLADDTPPTAPTEALTGMTLRPDLAIDLVAHEPAVEQPLYMSFDSRGRLWVTQYRQYQFPAGLKVISYDQHLRAKFDQVPKPPPAGVKGADRVTVHEDRDGDGLFDKSKVVIDGLNIATAAITGAGGIWVLNPPYLLYYADADGDDVPDGDPSVEISGFGLEDTHSVATSLQWGPDGWLYGATGSTTTGRVYTATSKDVRWEGQHIWRFHPQQKTFQIYAEGGGNTMSLEFDSKGRVFSGTNGGGTRGMHFEQGSYGEKNWGKHGPPMNPYAFHFFAHMKSEGDKRRFPQAFTIYEGGLLGADYAGRIIAPNALANLVWVSRFEQDGATFRTVDEAPLLTSPDRWFRPVDTRVGPDGCIYIADWYDTRLSHVRPVDDWHKTSGRIYRVRPKSGAPALAKFDLHQAEPSELLGYLSHANEWFRRQAGLEIGWRGLKSTAAELKQRAAAPGNPFALDALFALHQLGALDDATAHSLLQSADPYVRRWIVRQTQADWPKTLLALPTLAAQEQHLEVQTQLAASAKRLPSSVALPILEALLPSSDPRLTMMLWWLLESRAETNRDAVLGLFSKPAPWGTASARASLISDLTKRWAMGGGQANLDACAALYSQAPDATSRDLILKGLAAAFDGGDMPPLPSTLAQAIAASAQSKAGDDPSLAIRQGDAKAIAKGLAIIADKKAPTSQRAAVALVLAERREQKTLSALTAIYTSAQATSLKRALLPAVAKFGDHKIITTMLDGYEQRLAPDPLLRDAALRMIAGREEWAKILMTRIDQWQVPSKHITADMVRQLSIFDEPSIKAGIEKHWPGILAVAPTAEIEAENTRIRTALKAGGTGDAVKGQLLFTQRCAACHKLFGDGNVIGPDLTGYERSNLDFWLSNILTPSLEIREGYGAYMITLKNGQVLTGMMAAQDARSLTLRDVANQSTKIQLSDLDQQVASPVSLMPPGLLTGITDQELRDLFAYLQRTE